MGLRSLSHKIRCARGFTLLEMLAVLAIMALMIGLAGYSLHGVLHRATHQQAMAALLAFDAAARDRAVRLGQPATLSFEPRQIVAAHATQTHADRRVGTLPQGYRFEMRLLGRHARTAGRNQLTINAQGRSPSYRVKVDGPQGTTQWMVVCGLGGQAQIFNDETTVDAISELALATRLPR